MALQACECAQVCVSGFSRVGRPPRALRRRLDVSSERFFSFTRESKYSQNDSFLWYEKDLVSKVRSKSSLD